MKLLDLLLIAALVAVCVALGLVAHPSIALVVFAAGAVALWFLLDDA